MRRVDTAQDEVLSSAERTLDAVDAALGRLADGSYGICASCGAAIPDDELAATPTVLACGHHGD